MASTETQDDAEQFRFFSLGGGMEVGRSCHIIQFKGKTVMLDAGVHPGHTGLASLPFYDEFDLATVDVLLVSHFHLDHAATLPYVMQHTGFKGRVFMTHPTKAIYRWLLNDFVKVTSIGEDSQMHSSTLYTDEDLRESFDRIETVDYHATTEIDGIRFTAYHAGHVLGAAMFFVEIGGIKVLFTGDYSREEDRHLNVAEVPPMRPDVLICEATFGTATHEPREDKEAKLIALIHSTLAKGGRCLLPVFALGRAQELLLILEEYWRANDDLAAFNVYFASSLARKCMVVYQTYINMMNEGIRRRARDSGSNPFNFKFIKNIRSLDRFDDLNPCVVVAAPGMLQNGVSRELLERWAPDDRNSLVITGYSVEGTMAKEILAEPAAIPSSANPDVQIPRRLHVEEISFAAHVDYEQNTRFIELVDPKSIILVHGESNPMGRLKSALLSKYQRLKGTADEVKVYNPRNCDDLRLSFKGIKVAKAVGAVVESVRPDAETQVVSAVLVQKNFDLNLLKVEDLREYSGLSTALITEKQTVRCCAGRDVVHFHLTQMFGFVDVAVDDAEEFSVDVMSCVRATFQGDVCTVEWQSSMINDTIADSVIAIVLNADSSPASVRLSSRPCGHAHGHGDSDGDAQNDAPTDAPKQEPQDDVLAAAPPAPYSDVPIAEKMHRIAKILQAQFGDSLALNASGDAAVIKIGKNEAKVDIMNATVDCSSGVLKGRIENMLKRATVLVAPLAKKNKL